MQLIEYIKSLGAEAGRRRSRHPTARLPAAAESAIRAGAHPKR